MSDGFRAVTDDVVIYCYTNSNGSHSAVIRFYEDIDSLISYDRVKLEIDSDSIYFIGSSTEGLRLNNHKIQVQSFAQMLESWKGVYPLTYDIKRGCYKIDKLNRKEYINERRPERKGTKHINKHKITEKRDPYKKKDIVSLTDINTDDTTVNYKNVATTNPKIHVDKDMLEIDLNTSERIFLSVLLDKSMSMIDSKDYDKAKAIMITMKSLIEK